MTPRRTSSMRGFMRPSVTLMGTPISWYMSVCIHMTSGNLVLAVPMGWWATRAETFLPFSLSLSARRTSAGPTSIPHMRHSASMSRASSAITEKRESV